MTHKITIEIQDDEWERFCVIGQDVGWKAEDVAQWMLERSAIGLRRMGAWEADASSIVENFYLHAEKNQPGNSQQLLNTAINAGHLQEIDQRRAEWRKELSAKRSENGGQNDE